MTVNLSALSDAEGYEVVSDLGAHGDECVGRVSESALNRAVDALTTRVEVAG